MRVLALMGSPRLQGNNAALLSAFIEGLGSGSGGTAEIRRVNLHQVQIKPCLSCGGCHQNGECVQRDDMMALYPLLAQSDIVVLAAPIYFSGLCAQAKLMIDRCQPYWAIKYLLKRDLFAGRQRRGYFISTCGQVEKFDQFAGARQVMGTFYHMMGIEAAGSTLLSDIDTKPVSGRLEVLEDIKDAGAELATRLK